MNKTEMAEKLAKKADISKAKAAEIIDIIFSTKDGEGIIAVELDAGRKVNISGYSNFRYVHEEPEVPSAFQLDHLGLIFGEHK